MKKLLFALALVPAIAGFADEFDVNTVEDLYAKVGSAGDGDVINVAPGTYKMTAALGTLVINKGITVQSTGSWRDTFFEPEEGLTDMRLIKIAHAKGLFKGFTLRNVTSTANMTVWRSSSTIRAVARFPIAASRTARERERGMWFGCLRVPGSSAVGSTAIPQTA